MLKIRDLASRSDFELGPLSVSPSRRRVSGPAGEVHVAPLVMQVFLQLLDSDGRVVTRDELFNQCWGGVVVGDDSLNRTIAGVRRIASQVAPGLFEIETIPRTGYRLTGDIVDRLQATARAETRGKRALSRRSAVAGGAAAVALAAGAGIWWSGRPRSDPRFDDLMARGDAAFRDGTAFEAGAVGKNNSPAMARLYQQAVRSNPGSPRAWGLLAYFRSVAIDDLPAKELPNAVLAAQDAMRRALDIDPREPNARVARYLLQGPMQGWAERDRELRDILAADPANLPAMFELMPMLQSAGLTRESWGWNERILEHSPFFRACLVIRALKLWILGRIGEADDVINRVVSLWPDYWFGKYARFNIFALTGRPQAARVEMPDLGLQTVPKFGLVLDALELRTPSAIEAARSACVDAARAEPFVANDAVMYLGALGLVETAIELTEGFILWRGKFISRNGPDRRLADSYSRRMTQWLFTPPLAGMRADPRFLQICEGFGLTDYWRARNVKPDYLVYG